MTETRALRPTDDRATAAAQSNPQAVSSKAGIPSADFWNSIIRQHVDAATIADRVTKAVAPDVYRGWNVAFDYGYFNATHPDFEADWQGEEDGWVGSHPTLSGRTRADMEAEVDAWWEEHCATCDGSGTIWNNADPTSGMCHACEECNP